MSGQTNTVRLPSRNSAAAQQITALQTTENSRYSLVVCRGHLGTYITVEGMRLYVSPELLGQATTTSFEVNKE